MKTSVISPPFNISKDSNNENLVEEVSDHPKEKEDNEHPYFPVAPVIILETASEK